MQTFMPHYDFAASAAALDTARLGKQVLEVAQMLRALQTGTGMGAHHPATLAWRGCEDSLAMYGRACLAEHRKRTGKDGYANAGALFAMYPMTDAQPWWVCWRIRASHRGHLYRKDQTYYAQFSEFKEFPLLYPVTNRDLFCLVTKVGDKWYPVDKHNNTYGTPSRTAVAASTQGQWD